MEALQIAQYTFSQLGDYEITLKVSDAAGNWAVDVVNITVVERVFKVLVVPTRYSDEREDAFDEKIKGFPDRLKGIPQYFFNQSFGTDGVRFTPADLTAVIVKSNFYGDHIGSRFDGYYSPPPAYALDVWYVLKEKVPNLEKYDAILTYQTYAASKSNGFGKKFREETLYPMPLLSFLFNKSFVIVTYERKEKKGAKGEKCARSEEGFVPSGQHYALSLGPALRYAQRRGERCGKGNREAQRKNKRKRGKTRSAHKNSTRSREQGRTRRRSARKDKGE